jgi:hypothetical protein
MKKVELYEQFLKEEGFAPDVDADGDVMFKFEGGTYYILSNENDPRYFAMIFPNFWTIESADELQKAYAAANDVSRDTKVVKVHVNGKQSNVNASVEVYVDEPGGFKPFLKRALTVLQYAVSQFRTKMVG